MRGLIVESPRLNFIGILLGMKWSLFIGILFFSWIATGQITAGEERKARSILGESFTELPTQKSYTQHFDCEECLPDTCLVKVGEKVGAIANEEFVLFHDPISFSAEQEVYKSIRNTPVTTGEYAQFENWVRDSIAMEKVFWRSGFRDYNAKFILRDKKKQYFEDGQPIKIYSLGRYEFREEITFDRNYVLDYTKEDLVPVLADMYIPQPERILKLRVFDKRKFSYEYMETYESLESLSWDSVKTYFPKAQAQGSVVFNVKSRIPIMRAEYEYAKRSTRNWDELYVLGSIGVKTLQEHPVYGVKSFQADAFCNWKQTELQRQFDAKNVAYKVVVTLPTKADSEGTPMDNLAYTIPERNYTDQWKITNSEYKEFVAHVKDSVLRETLFLYLESNDDAIRYIEYCKRYFDEGALEFVDFDKYEQRGYLRDYFFLNYASKIKVNQHVLDSIVQEVRPDFYTYKYYIKDAHRLSLEGIYTKGVQGSSDRRFFDTTLWGACVHQHFDYYESFGKDYTITTFNQLGENHAIRVHANLQPFIQPISVAIQPENSQEIPDNEEFIQSINYEQALAFYNWKYPIHLAKEDDDWQDFVLPSKEEFQTVQRGGEILRKASTIDFPGTTFRYVVHLFPR